MNFNDSYQLCRIVMVNIGTNMRVPSLRITEVDPRGGTAVVGDNAVGKTTTLRLIPLFFGNPVGSVMAQHAGQDGSKFILPSQTSAICYEYQRMNDLPENRRLAVLRAPSKEGAEGLDYRIFETTFIKEMFIDGGHFLDDAASCERALALGIKPPTRKMTAAEYRSVILKHGFNTKDSEKLYRYASQHSYSGKSLANLDRLSAAMLKKNVSFDDLTRVAVDFIQEETGEDGEKVIKVRQSKKELEDWLRNYAAASSALKQEAKIASLDEFRLLFIKREGAWRVRHAQLDATILSREDDLKVIATDIRKTTEQRAEQVEIENLRLTEVAAAAQAASQAAAQAHDAFGIDERKSNYFQKEEAERWSNELHALGALEVESESLRHQARVATADLEQARAAYSERKEDVRTHSAERKRELEAQNPDIQRVYDQQIATLQTASEEEAAALAVEFKTLRAEAEERQGALKEQKGEAQGRVSNPFVAPELIQAESDARTRVTKANAANKSQQEIVTQAATALRTARAELDTRQGEKRSVDHILTLAVQTAERTKASYQAAPGTLLAALRAGPNEKWKADFSRVINPDLLQRKDLSPVFVEELAGQGVFGWSLDVENLDVPMWANNSEMHQAAEAAELAVVRARAAKETMDATLVRQHTAYEQADASHMTAQAQGSITQRAVDEANGAADLASEVVKRAQTAAREKATADRSLIDSQLTEVTAQLRRFDNDLQTRQKDIRDNHTKHRAEAKDRRDVSQRAVSDAIAALEKQTATSIAELEQQLTKHLSEKGVDVTAIEALNTKRVAIDKRITELGSHKSVVEDWKAWMEGGGPARLSELRTASLHAAEMSRQATAEEEKYRAVVGKATKEHTETIIELNQLKNVLTAELDILRPLKEHFQGFGASLNVESDTTIKSAELRVLVVEEGRELRECTSRLKSLQTELYRGFTTTESTTRQLFEASMRDAVNSVDGQAQALIQAYGKLRPQVVNNLNTTLVTIFAVISHLLRNIETFKKGVVRFNNKLQTSLSDVHCFKQFTDLVLNIVTDFDDDDLYKKLKKMDDVIRQHRLETNSTTYSEELPSRNIVEVLTKFQGVLGNEGTLEINLGSHVKLEGSVIENGQHRRITRRDGVAGVSSTGVTTLILITLLVGLVNVVRNGQPVNVPWVTDEVGQFDGNNLKALLNWLQENRIDVVTASPSLSAEGLMLFRQRYEFKNRGEIRQYRSKKPKEIGQEIPEQQEAAA